MWDEGQSSTQLGGVVAIRVWSDLAWLPLRVMSRQTDED